jgi:hypothetical protein
MVLFAVLGFTQEYRAERAIAALQQLAVPTVRVRRGGKLREVSAQELVPGDIVLLEAGNAVPADVRLLESTSLRIQEAALTGESEAVEKTMAAIPAPDLPLGDPATPPIWAARSPTAAAARCGGDRHAHRARPGRQAHPGGRRREDSAAEAPRTFGKGPGGRRRHHSPAGAARRLVERRIPGRHVPHGRQRGHSGGARGASGRRRHHPRSRRPTLFAAQRLIRKLPAVETSVRSR